MPTALFLAITAGLAVAVVVRLRRRRRISRFLQGRTPLSAEEFAALFASDAERPVAVSIRELLAGWIGFDVALLRPDDEFCGDLLLDAADGLDPEEFLRSVEERWAVTIPDDVAADLRTIRQLAREVARRAGAAQGPQAA